MRIQYKKYNIENTKNINTKIVHISDIHFAHKYNNKRLEMIKNKIWNASYKVDETYKLNFQQDNDDKNDEDAETSESVTLFFDDIPYDTYIIETIENSNFQGSLTLLRFNEIKPNKDNLITKYIGLWHQENAILNIHLYTEKEKSEKPAPKLYNGMQDNNNNPSSNIVIPGQEKKSFLRFRDCQQ